MGNKIKEEDYIGKVFNRLTILNFEDPVTYFTKEGYLHKNTTVKCLCNCGNLWIGSLTTIKTNKTKSCGCYNIESAKIRGKDNKSHGLSNSSEYNTWRSMKARCLNSKDPNYPYYGGKGITICEKWLESFENFIADMGLKPTLTHSIDRIDNNLGYFPENCRWATDKEQSNNQTSNKKITYKGKTQNLSKWAEDLNIDYSTLHTRICFLNWTIEKAFETPINLKYKRN